MLQILNAYFLVKIGADTAENEQHFAEILPKTGNYPTGPVLAREEGAIPRSAAASRRHPGQRRSSPWLVRKFGVIWA